MESGLIFHSHTPSFHRWPFSCSLLISPSHPPRFLPLCSTHRRQYFCVVATRDKEPGRSSRNEFPRIDAGGGDSLYDGSRRPGVRKRRRPWWDNVNDGIYQEEYPVELKRGILDEFIDSFWFFKLLGSYGWTLPIILLSLLLSTGPRAFLTAMLIPVGLSVLTFVFRLLWGWTHGISFEYRLKRKKKSGTRKVKSAFMVENEGETLWTKDPRMYRAYRTSRGNGSAAYGGWEDLIDEGLMGTKVDRGLDTKDEEVMGIRSGKGLDTKDEGVMGTRSGKGLDTKKEETEALPQEELESRVQVREQQPLVLRLLVALFPFLNSWVDLL